MSCAFRDGRFEVPAIVHRIEDAENIDAVIGSGLDECLDDVIGVSEEILAGRIRGRVVVDVNA